MEGQNGARLEQGGGFMVSSLHCGHDVCTHITCIVEDSHHSLQMDLLVWLWVVAAAGPGGGQVRATKGM